MKYSTRVAMMASFGLAAGVSNAANLIKNGDFDNLGKVFKSTNSYGSDDIQTAGSTSIPDWTNVTPPGAPAKYFNEAWVGPNNLYGLTASPENGSGYFVDLTGQGDNHPYGGLSQKITTVPGMGYTLTFALGSSTTYNSNGLGAAALTASASGTSLLASHLFTSTPNSANHWVTESLQFIADSDSTTIELLADSSYTSRYVGLDDVSVESRVLSTTTTLSSSTTSATPGSSVSLTALVKPNSGTATPTGKVQFKSGSTLLGTITLNGAAQAVLTTSALSVGKDSVTAVYSSDEIYGASTSSPIVITVAAGSAGAIELSVKTLAFGNEASGSTSAAKTVTVTNTGSSTLTVKSIALSGSQSDDFVLANKCGTSLAAKASCTFSVSFKPVAVGAKAASVSISDSAGTQSVSLTGTGTAASGTGTVKLSATSLSFGSEVVGKTSTAKTLTITNSGTAALSIASIALSGSQDDDFGLASACGTTLAAAKSCTVSVTFKPVAAGAKSASIKITDGASGSPQTVALTGTGS
jgi:hypothetical protein